MFGDAPAGFYPLGVLGALLMYAAIVAFVSGQRHRKARYYQRDSDKHQSKSDKSADGTTIIETENEPSDAENRNSYNLERDRYDLITIGIGLAGLIVVIYYTLITYNLLLATIGASIDNERRFRITERPWIDIAEIANSSPLTFVTGTPNRFHMDVDYTLRKGGRTPGQAVAVFQIVMASDMPELTAFNEANCGREQMRLALNLVMRAPTIFPNIPDEHKATRVNAVQELGYLENGKGTITHQYSCTHVFFIPMNLET